MLLVSRLDTARATAVEKVTVKGSYTGKCIYALASTQDICRGSCDEQIIEYYAIIRIRALLPTPSYPAHQS